MMVAPMMAPMPGMAAAPQKQWIEPTFVSVMNDAPCFCKANLCFSNNTKTFQTMQGVTCEMPGCQQQAVAQCQGDISFCPQCDGPNAYSDAEDFSAKPI